METLKGVDHILEEIESTSRGKGAQQPRGKEKTENRGVKMDDEGLERKRRRWLEEYKELISGVPPVLPPLREVQHRIPLVDPKKRYPYHMPRCPDAIKPALLEKIEKYLKAGWWERKMVEQVAPMLCIPKKDGQLRTVVDCRLRNNNTVRRSQGTL